MIICPDSRYIYFFGINKVFFKEMCFVDEISLAWKSIGYCDWLAVFVFAGICREKHSRSSFKRHSLVLMLT